MDIVTEKVLWQPLGPESRVRSLGVRKDGLTIPCILERREIVVQSCIVDNSWAF